MDVLGWLGDCGRPYACVLADVGLQTPIIRNEYGRGLGIISHTLHKDGVDTHRTS